jgi:adenylate cyclase
MRNSGKFIERRDGLRVRFSIGAKLITIISIIVLVSLGSITALVSWLVREDLKVSAEENNFEVNRRAAAETEQTLEKMRLLSLVFSRAAALAKNGDEIQEEADYFFTQNPQIAALFYVTAPSSAWTNKVFANGRFFLSHGIDTEIADALLANSKKMQEDAAMGQTILINPPPPP